MKKLIVAGVAVLTAVTIFFVGYLAGLGAALSRCFVEGEEYYQYGTELLNDKVIGYLPAIQQWADECEIGEYALVIAAMMMQESHGNGTDPMQSSECSDYNTRYPIGLNTIKDPYYSIEVGVKEFAKAIRLSGCESPFDEDRLNVALQSYNFGPYYITWVQNNYNGKYSLANAKEYSNYQQNRLGWSSTYGDPLYVPHVRQYLSLTVSVGGAGNSSLITIAEQELATVGQLSGAQQRRYYCNWFGWGDTEWCAIFVSYCARKAGVDTAIIPSSATCSAFISHFKAQNRWHLTPGWGGSYVPKEGDLIIFTWSQSRDDWNHIGIVTGCDGNTVYTIEGNSGNRIKKKSYPLNSKYIYGICDPQY